MSRYKTVHKTRSKQIKLYTTNQIGADKTINVGSSRNVIVFLFLR